MYVLCLHSLLNTTVISRHSSTTEYDPLSLLLSFQEKDNFFHLFYSALELPPLISYIRSCSPADKSKNNEIAKFTDGFTLQSDNNYQMEML